MGETYKTVLTKGGKDGPVRVNEHEYDEKVHGPLHKPTKAEKDAGVDQQSMPATASVVPPEGTTAPPAPSAPNPESATPPATVAPGQMVVGTEGRGDKKRYVALDTSGNRIEMDGIEKDGYGTEQEAWNAIIAAQGKTS